MAAAVTGRERQREQEDEDEEQETEMVWGLAGRRRTGAVDGITESMLAVREKIRSLAS